tara:strand:+ start:972 stop:1433 length:462 start_codon:yes stop_codon:yes gene_type:complete
MSDSADNTIDGLSDFLASDPIPSRPDVSASDGSVFTAVSLVTLGLGDWGGDASRAPRFNDESLEPRPLPPDRFFNATASSALLRLWLLTRESRLLIPFLKSVSLAGAGSSVISPVVLVVGFISPVSSPRLFSSSSPKRRRPPPTTSVSTLVLL